MKYFIPLFTLLLCGSAFGQGGNLGQLEMNVLDEYQARVGEAVKVREFPSFKDTSARKLPVQYQINSQPLQFSFEPEPLPPATIAKVPVEDLLNGMVKVGYGLYHTPLVEAYYNSGRSSKQQYGFYGRHLSTKGGVRNIRYSNNSLAENRLGGYYNRFYKDVKWNSSVMAEFDKVSYYGRPALPDSLESDTEEDPLFNWYRKFGFSTQLLETSDKGLGFYKKAALQYYHLSDNYLSIEDHVKINSTLGLDAADQPVEVDVNLSYFHTSNDSLLYPASFEKLRQSYFTLQVRPNISTYWNDLLFEFALNLYINNQQISIDNGDGAKAAFFPEILVSYPVVEDVVNIYGGVKGFQRHNTINSLISDNIFTEPGQLLIPTRNTDIFAGTNGVLSSNATFDVQGGLKIVKDMTLFYRNPFFRQLDSIGSGLAVIYDDVNVFYVNGEVSLNLQNNLQLSLSGTLNSYNTSEEALAWHRPRFTSELTALYTFREKIEFSTQLFYSGKREAFSQELNPAVNATLNPYLNVNLGIEYFYNQRLSAFINVYNLSNSNYEHYLGYRAQNINFLLGIGYQF